MFFSEVVKFLLRVVLSTSVNNDNIEKVKEEVLKNRRVDIRVITENLNITYGST